MPIPTHNNRPAPAAALWRRRMQQLEATLEHCLRKSGGSDSGKQSVLMGALSDWLNESDPASRRNLLDSLAVALQRAFPTGSACFSMPAVSAAFARGVLELAQQAVAKEAARAGHGNSYDTLSKWIEQEANSTVLESLGQAMGRSPSDLRTALGRLRDRFLQRVEAGLADWCDSPTSRQNLRRRLRDALLESEISA